MSIDYQIILQKGMKVNECVTENEDRSYTIFVNADLCQAKQKEACEHAILHIKNCDFGKCDVQEIEAIAHGIAGGEFP